MADIHIKAGDGIQSAINGAVSGDTIILADGIYREAVTVSKAVTLRAGNPGQAIIDGGYHPGLRGKGVGFDGKPTAAGAMPSPVEANKNAFGFRLAGALNSYQPLVKVTSPDAVIAGLVIRNSAGRGLSVLGDRTTVRGCHVDFCYNGGLWIGGSSNSQKVKDVTAEDCAVTRGSMKAFDWTRNYGGTPMGVDVCCLTRYSSNTTFRRMAVAYNLGEGISSGRGAVWTLIEDCDSHSNLHANFYANGGAGKLTMRGSRAYDCINVAGPLQESKLGMFDNCVLGDEDEAWISGPGIEIYDCLFAPSYSSRVFEIAGWNGSGKFPRPFAFRGYMGYCTIAAGPRNNGTLFGSSPHMPHSGLIENLIVTGSVTVHNYGKGWSGVLVRHILSADAIPAALGVVNNKLATNGILTNPTKEVNAVGFDLWGDALPDPYATDFDPDNYAPIANSQAYGFAASGAANGVTPPVTRPDVGAALAVDEPEPEPEPEPDEPPAWAQPLVDLGAQLQAAEDILTQLAGMKATLAGLIDALDDQLVEAAATYDKLAAALNGEGV